MIVKNGQRFNNLTVIKPSKKPQYFRCKCKCGTIKNIRKDHLVKGETKSCGCIGNGAEKRRLDLKGQQFGCLTAIKLVKDPNRGYMTHWECKCKCGKSAIVGGGTLKAGKQKSCGKCHFRKPNARHGKDHHAWVGGRIKSGRGYIQILIPDHPKCNKNGYVLEHRVVMENKLRRFLFDDEIVHHKNGIRDDNRQSNLELWVKTHPKGQRVADLVEFAHYILDRYDA